MPYKISTLHPSIAFSRSQDSATQKPSCWWHWECRCKRSRLTWGHGGWEQVRQPLGGGAKEGWWVNVWWKHPTKQQERISWQWEVFKCAFLLFYFCLLAHGSPKKKRVGCWVINMFHAILGGGGGVLVILVQCWNYFNKYWVWTLLFATLELQQFCAPKNWWWTPPPNDSDEYTW